MTESIELKNVSMPYSRSNHNAISEIMRLNQDWIDLNIATIHDGREVDSKTIKIKIMLIELPRTTSDNMIVRIAIANGFSGEVRQSGDRP